MSKYTKKDIKITIIFWGGIVVFLIGVFLMVHSLLNIWK